MLVFKMKKNGEPFEVVLYQYTGKDTSDAETKDLANSLWLGFLSDPSITELRGLKPDGTVKMPPENKPFTWGIWAKFSDNPKAKLYPFECNKELKAGTRFIAMPNGIPSIATVMKCSWVARSKVIDACNGRQLFKIKDIVTAV